MSPCCKRQRRRGLGARQGGIIDSLPKGGIHISSSTISVALSGAREGACSRPAFSRGAGLGRPDVAAAGQLFVITAGSADAIAAATPLFDAIGQKTFVVSETPKAANLVKLSGNFLIAVVIESLGEAMALVGKGGVGRHQYLDILTSTLFNAPIYKTYGALIADKKFSPAGFAAPLGQKDIRLTLAAAEELCVPLPLASLLRDRFLTLMAHGGDELDWSAIGGLAVRTPARKVEACKRRSGGPARRRGGSPKPAVCAIGTPSNF